MNITVSVEKTIEQNAKEYFERAKKIRKKIDGANEALLKNQKKLEKLLKTEQKTVVEEKKTVSHRQKHWYEKFRWFISSEGFLVVGGRDSTTNEIIIKKHAEKNDIVFHTDMAGSPFFVIKTEGKKPGDATMNETANATISFSRAWKLGLSNTSVFHVLPEQVSKEAQSGEYLSKGAFMIYGKTNYIDNSADCAIGITKGGAIMGGPLSAVKKHCENYVEVFQGDDKISNVAKKIKQKLSADDLDEIIRALPPGNVSLKK